jgi:hypothetical protein
LFYAWLHLLPHLEGAARFVSTLINKNCFWDLVQALFIDLLSTSVSFAVAYTPLYLKYRIDLIDPESRAGKVMP